MNARITCLILKPCVINACRLLVSLEDNNIDMCNFFIHAYSPNFFSCRDYAEFMNPKEVNNFV
jgi:hypothetical protein